MLQQPHCTGCQRTDPGLGRGTPDTHHLGEQSSHCSWGDTAKASLASKLSLGNCNAHLAPADAENSHHAIFGDVTGPAPAHVMSIPGLFTGHFSLALQSTKCYSAQAADSQAKTLNFHTSCTAKLPGVKFKRGNRGPVPRPTVPP